MARPESRYVCQDCGDSTLRWEGRCRACGAWNTLVETLVGAPRSTRGSGGADPLPGPADPVPLADFVPTETERRTVGIGEVDRVLGGGLVPGSLVLLGGEPGIGKSTLVLEIVAGIARRRSGARVLYASGEESVGQLQLRAMRLGVMEDPGGRAIHVLAETDVETIVRTAESSPTALLVVDSIQTLTVPGLDGPPGSVGQVREAAARLTEYAKASGVPVVLVGHVTKEGSLAGPKTLEHLVDAVLTLEGERSGPLRLLRSTKNRYGSTDEVGVLEMTGSGLREVVDPARAFLGDRPAPAPGVVVAATLEGSRPLLVEVQALVAPAPYGNPRRTVAGLDPNRLALLVAVLGRRSGVGVGSHDVYASLAGGLVAGEPALDLPLALALASSLRDRPIRSGTVACGEVNLLGELRSVPGLERRLREIERLGFTRAIVPRGAFASASRDVGGGSAGNAESDDGRFRVGVLEIVAVRTLREAIEAALAPAPVNVREPV